MSFRHSTMHHEARAEWWKRFWERAAFAVTFIWAVGMTFQTITARHELQKHGWTAR